MKTTKKMHSFLKIIGSIFTSLTCVSCASQHPHPMPSTPSQKNDLSPLYLFQSLEESENIPLKVDGEIPSWLEGEFVRNGPGLIRDNRGETVKSWFDGLAKLYAFTIKQGKVSYTCKFLRSEAYKKLQATGVFDFVGFAQKPKTDQFSLIDFLFDIKNKEIINANVNVAKINNHLVALTEIPLPVEFDKNLNTLGIFDYADSLTKNYSFESAHVLKDPDTKATWNFLIEIGVLDTAYQIYKIPPLSSERQLLTSIPVSSISYMHSFCLAGRYFILIDYPLRAQNPKDIANGFIEAFAWNDKSHSIVYVIDKNSGKCQTFLTNPFFSFHYVNGFEKDGKVFVDLIGYATADIINNINAYPFLKNAGNTLLRLEINPLTGTIKTTQQTQEHVEFPRLNETLIGKDYQYFYAIHNRKQGNGLIKYDQREAQHRHWFQEGTYANEPIFIAHPHAKTEDDGVIFSIINDLNTKTSFLLILNAKDFKELARITAPHLIPFGFHGQFFKERELCVP